MKNETLRKASHAATRFTDISIWEDLNYLTL